MHLILLGAPGVGKGTQAKFIEKKLIIPHISTGDMLREAVQAGNEIGLCVSKVMAAGELVMDELIILLVKQRICRSDCQRGFLLDGFPRTLPQAQALDDTGIRIDQVILLDMSDEQLLTRLSGRRVHLPSGRVYHLDYYPPKTPNKDDITGEPLTLRADDSIPVIRQRLLVYHQQTKPLIEYYRKKSDQGKLKFVIIDANQPMAEVSSALLKHLDFNYQKIHNSL